MLAVNYVTEMIYQGRAFQLSFLILVGILTYISYYITKRGKEWTIRPIEALDAIDEGVGRAAETGRPILVLPGISGLGSAQTLAGLTVFGEIAQRAVEIGITPYLITSSTDVVTASEAIIRQTLEAVGKPELYQPGRYIKWYGSGQFVYAVGAAGHIMQEKPAFVSAIGYFLADVIVTMETATRVGSLIVGGTTDQSATPLMAMLSDYLLIGEEMYAASAVLTKDNVAAGTLAAEDLIKVILLILMVVGCLAWAVGSRYIYNLMGV
ncbi:hypothetical protein DRO56_00665 [Candidatus Bathyarchaeota archaeon]|nr:MAG: hypothetical protein DRO56_00665 [Candidatus Bathyarchaeota archaeon]